MNNESTYSTEVLELLSKKSFQQLSRSEKEMVEVEMDAETYTELHKSYSQLQAAEQRANPPHPVPPISPAMRQALGKRRSHQPIPLWLVRPIPFWKAAAVVLILFGISLLFWQSKTNLSGELMTIVDTVYVSQPKEVIFDTVYLGQNADQITSPTLLAPITATLANSPIQDERNEVGGIQILTLDQMDQVKRAGNPRKERELFEQFGVVSM